MTNPSASQKKRSKGRAHDWHRADIVAALHKRGITLAGLSRAHGLAARTLSNAMERHYPRAERLIAQALDMCPEDIWPQRYRDKKIQGESK